MSGSVELKVFNVISWRINNIMKSKYKLNVFHKMLLC
jgi:hypothetical protein